MPRPVAEAASRAYRELRRIQHRARLDEAPTELDGERLAAVAHHRDAVLALWRGVFGHLTPADAGASDPRPLP